jgi:hypothetical protein
MEDLRQESFEWMICQRPVKDFTDSEAGRRRERRSVMLSRVCPGDGDGGGGPAM